MNINNRQEIYNILDPYISSVHHSLIFQYGRSPHPCSTEIIAFHKGRLRDVYDGDPWIQHVLVDNWRGWQEKRRLWRAIIHQELSYTCSCYICEWFKGYVESWNKLKDINEFPSGCLMWRDFQIPTKKMKEERRIREERQLIIHPTHSLT